jgi:hypothetical protein
LRQRPEDVLVSRRQDWLQVAPGAHGVKPELLKLPRLTVEKDDGITSRAVAKERPGVLQIYQVDAISAKRFSQPSE